MSATAAGRVLGLDLGDVRIGAAISDPDRRVAVALGTIHVGQPPGELLAVAEMVRANDVTATSDCPRWKRREDCAMRARARSGSVR